MPTVTHMDDTVHGMLDRAISTHADRTALVDGPSGQSVKFRELGRRVDQIAGWLWHAGLRPGDHLAVWSPNVPPVVAITLAALRLGATVVPLSPAWTAHEARRVVQASEMSVIVTIPSLVEAAVELDVRRVVVLGDADRATPLAELLDHDLVAEQATVHPDQVAFVCASSGTTGSPKGVQLTHRQMVAVCRQIAEAFELGPHDATVAIAPWFHILGLTAELIAPLARGAKVISVPAFDPAHTFTLIGNHSVTFMAVPPPVAAAIIRHPTARDADLTSLELVAVGGAPLPVEHQHALAERLPGCAIGQGWGLTETSGALCIPTRRDGATPGTVGRPLPDTEIRVVNPDTGQLLRPDHDGELICRGPQLMLGYLDAPADTTAAFTTDGWLRTGDLGHIDPDGNIVITGRIKDLIKVNALQVSPTEIEDVLLAQPGIADAAIIGRPDERTGETPIAFIVTEPSVEIDLDRIRAALDERLAPYKRPTDIHLIDQLPRTPSGKLLRRNLTVPASPPSETKPVPRETSLPNGET